MKRRSAAKLGVRAALVSALVLMLSAGAAPGGAGAGDLVSAAPEAKPKRSSVVRGTGILRYGNTYPAASGYERYSYVIVSRHMAHLAPRLPGTSLVYMNATTLYPSYSTGVSYQEATANDWLLRDASGAPVTNSQFHGYVGDVGNPAYQKRWLGNVLAYLKKSKNEGVFIDEVLSSPLILNGQFPAKYPTHEAWEEATVSFVANVSKALRAKGHYVLVNAAAYNRDDPARDMGTTYARFYQRIARHVDGIMNEWWVQDPVDPNRMRALGTNWYEFWSGWQALVAVTQAAGADFFGVTYSAGSNPRAIRYGRASFLLDWNGEGGAFIWVPTDRVDPYHSVFVRDLGKPLRPKFERMPGVWQRRYEKGIVVLNATKSPVTLRVDGALFTIGPVDALYARARKAAS